MVRSPEKENILVAMSGGVDSSVAAALLIEEGHSVEGVYVRTWENEEDILSDCPGAKDLADAREVAELLGIPLRVVNFVDFYYRNVVDPMVQGYAQGITPNPDILCNRKMKFGALLDYARQERFDALATGHYCQRKVNPDGRAELWEGKDKNKDQSYFLAQLSQEQLEHARFPLGQMDKSKVREFARSAGLGVAEKKDSQGICFLGKVKVPQFLSQFIEDSPGEIVTTDGKVVGTHLGLHRYTLGQRKGIGVPSNTDYEKFVVTGKESSSNRLIVAFDRSTETSLWGNLFGLEKMQFLCPVLAKSAKLELLAKARYRDPSTPVSVTLKEEDKWLVTFKEAQRALTPGQVLALYRGEQLVASGVYSLSLLGRAAISS
jgi:tRNA-specific 2-thiouridylase